ncbi:metallo-dependent phosphatase [Moesziomyces antarcticus]|uniref:Related to 5`-nucleotidase n=1 Tax=Pseudozyma antarctica TaxID=84753 RepID=A0A5C3FHP6_PSEA2|nr:metallo-dependent phosphatase [Moesziomyces antarcticus]GAK63314.1 metallo-dependent phosphatase [Moesziomyces antarcticus]SPO43898.1 related to 5`-nucleotidase precursor [Moesziomyces antarcticus]
MSVTLPIIHFNDVYRVRQNDKKSGGTIGADQFAAKIQSIRESWGEPSDLANLPPPPPSDGVRDWSEHATARERKGLVLFSGDLYSPSVESSVTRGTHLVPVINAFNLDCACLGNHDWDFGYPHLQTLMAQNNFPWLFSNVVDRTNVTNSAQDKEGDGGGSTNWDEDLCDDDAQVAGTLRSWTTTVQGVKVGCIGIVEKEWIATVPNFPHGLVYRNMAKTALKLSRILRDPAGEACELVIAITHSRLPNDIDFANEVGAVANADATSHGVDLVLGGHDHIYYVGNGAAHYDGDAFQRGEPGTENDSAAMVVKSGTDFRDLSELKLELSERDDAAVRKRTIRSLSVKRYRTQASDPSLPAVKTLLDDLLAKISKSTGQSVAYTLTPWDVRSEKVRTDESAFGNFVADVLMNSYEEVLRERDNRGELSERRPPSAREVDCCIICGGSLRGDQVYGPGKIALSDVLEILPFEDAVVCKELKGQDIWDALENGLSAWPKQEGRFPQVAGMMVKWDSTKPPGKRLVSVELLDNPLDTPASAQPKDAKHGDAKHDDADVGKLRRFSLTELPGGGYDLEVHRPALVSRGALELDKTYRVVTREYLAEGYDGFDALKRGRFVVDHENGQLMSAIVRKFLLGASYLWRMKQIRRLQDGQGTDGSAALPGPDGPKAEVEDDKMRDVDTLSKRTRIAITRARSLNLLKRAIKPSTQAELPTTPVKRGRAGSAGEWCMVVDQSPGGFRDALHIGGSEHHSAYDSVSRRFNEPLTAPHSSATSAAAAVDGVNGVDTASRAAKRTRTDAAQNGGGHDSALFDPTLASGLLTQIRELLALVSRAAAQDGQLYTGDTSDQPAAAAHDEVEGGDAAIALGATADDGDDHAALALLAAGASRAQRGEPTALEREIVSRATALRAAFSTLEEAAKTLPGAAEMGITDQRRLIAALDSLVQKQNTDLKNLPQTHADPANKEEGEAKPRFGKGAVASSSFHLDQGQMDQLRSDISAATQPRADDMNLAFVSPLVDGRLVDIARST